MSVDYLAMVEAAYRVDKTDHDWLMGISDAGRKLGVGSGVYAFVYDASEPARLGVSPIGGSGAYRDKSEELFQVAKCGQPLASSLVKALYWGHWDIGFAQNLVCGPPPRVLETAFAMAGTSDAYSVRGQDSSRRGVMLTVPIRDGFRLSPRTRGTLCRIAAHFGAAFRLRRGRPARVEDSSAIFDQSGRLQHLGDDMRGDGMVSALRLGVEHLVKGRSLRRESPGCALALWNELIAGRWSVFERFDNDGRRFLVAQENAPHRQDPRALCPDERRVALHVASGRSLKYIAYELGVAPSTVSYRVKHVLRKLGLRNRSELVGLFGAA